MAGPTNKKDAAPSTKKVAPVAAAPKRPAPAAQQQTVTQVNPAGAAQMSTKERDDRSATPDQIAARAYELWLQRGGHHGDDQGDWHRAESELTDPTQS